MKKTIIALLALAGVAGATEGVPHIWTPATDVTAAVDKLGASVSITSNAGQLGSSRENYVIQAGDKTNDGTVSITGTPTVGDNGSFTTGTDGTKIELTSLYDFNAGDVTITFTANVAEGAVGNILTFGEDANWSYSFNVNDSGESSFFTKNGYTTQFSAAVNNPVTLIGEHDYVLSWATKSDFGVAGGGRVLTLFVDGVRVMETSEFTQDYGQAYNTDYVFGGTTGGNVTFSNVTFHRGSIIVPEPATATLSLLALAGLAARRRRK